MSNQSARILHFQLSSKDADRLEKQAHELGVSLSELLRRRVLESQAVDLATVRVPLKEWQALVELVRRLRQGSSDGPSSSPAPKPQPS